MTVVHVTAVWCLKEHGGMEVVINLTSMVSMEPVTIQDQHGSHGKDQNPRWKFQE